MPSEWARSAGTVAPMSLTVSVPLNTMLADLDESLRRLLRRELSRHGLDGMNIAFDAPTKEWSAALSGPTLNLFLYDIREALELREREWHEHRGNGNARLQQPPMHVECSYAITAWTRAVEDEHRMLSQVLAVLFAHPVLVGDDVVEALAATATSRHPITTRVGQAKGEDKADFWNAIGGAYRVALDYVVRLVFEPGVTVTRGPPVSTATMRFGPRNPRSGGSAIEERHHLGGEVVDATQTPVAGVWVVLPDIGAWCESKQDGSFRLARVPAGTHRVIARAPDGSEVADEVTVPGHGVRISLRAPASGR